MAERWIKCIRSLWTRLLLAREKTHNVVKRSRSARDVAVSKITFLARHCWSPPSVVTRLHSLILIFLWGVRDGKRCRPWVPSERASLPVQQDGLEVPCIRTELIFKKATEVGQWDAVKSSGDILIKDFYGDLLSQDRLTSRYVGRWTSRILRVSLVN